MHVLQGASDLVNVGPDLFFLELNLVFLRSLEHKLEVSFLSPLDCNEELVQFVVDKPVQVLDDIRVV